MLGTTTSKPVRLFLIKPGVYLGLLPTQEKTGGDEVTVGVIVSESPVKILEAYRGMRAETVGRHGAILKLGRIR
jgi:hypothetical protein